MISPATRERLFFKNFILGLSIGGALGEWVVVCWIVGHPPLVLHAVVPVLLAVVNRQAARRLEREPAAGIFAGPLGHVVLACAFGAMMCTGVLGVVAGAWAFCAFIGALSAEARVVIGTGTDPVFGPAFRIVGSGALALVAGAMAYGYVRGHRRLMVTRLPLPFPDLPPALAGLRIVHVSDLHLGPLADRDGIRGAIDEVLALDPDVVCVTGDIVDSPAADLDTWIPELARLTARRGVFAILGNHDRHIGADDVARALRERTSWRVLRDDIATIDVDGARVNVIGFEDRPHHCATDGLAPLLARAPRGEPSILLAHRPCVFPMAAAAGVHLMLAGHTHGGQLAVPGAPRLNVARAVMGRFDAGAFTLGGSTLYVSRGLGVSGQPLRIGVPREIAALTLVDAAS